MQFVINCLASLYMQVLKNQGVWLNTLLLAKPWKLKQTKTEKKFKILHIYFLHKLKTSLNDTLVEMLWNFESTSYTRNLKHNVKSNKQHDVHIQRKKYKQETETSLTIKDELD